MKISKTLVKAILVGVTISTTISCSTLKENNELIECSETCSEECNGDHGTKGDLDNCPGCGLG